MTTNCGIRAAIMGGVAIVCVGIAPAHAVDQCPNWVPVGEPFLAFFIRTLAVWDDGLGGGPMLYAGGQFDLATNDGVLIDIARWNGKTWMSLSATETAGVEGGGGSSGVQSLLAVPPGMGGIAPGLYVAGTFTTTYPFPSGTAPKYVARWDGSTWFSLGSGVNQSCESLALYTPPGGTPGVYVGGWFTSAGSSSAARIARWNGSSWSNLPGGFVSNVPYALTVYDDGSGPALIAGGRGLSGPFGSDTIAAKWNGSTWTTLGTFLGGGVPEILGMATWDDGRGSALYVVGEYTSINGISLKGIARWDGASWSAVGPPTNYEIAGVAVYDDGNGSALYVGGPFNSMGGVAAKRIAKWDGQAWSSLGPGLGHSAGEGFDELATLYTAPVGGSDFSDTLYAGGRGFTFPDTPGSANIARMTFWSPLGPADLFCGEVGPVINGLDLAVLLAAWGDCPKRGECPADLDGDGVVNGVDLAILLSQWG